MGWWCNLVVQVFLPHAEEYNFCGISAVPGRHYIAGIPVLLIISSGKPYSQSLRSETHVLPDRSKNYKSGGNKLDQYQSFTLSSFISH